MRAVQLDAWGKPKRVRYLPAEHDEQVALVTWLQWTHPEAAEHCYAIPNGGHRHQAVAKRMKDEGVKRGVPDLCIALPRNGRCGLYLELKASGTTACSVSKEQRAWIERLREAGYAAEVAHGLDEAKRVIEGYLSNA